MVIDTFFSPLYLQVHDVIKQRILDRICRDRIPAEYDLALEFGVSYDTMRRAVQILKDEGLLGSKRGYGTFITLPAGDDEKPDDEEVNEISGSRDDLAEMVRSGQLQFLTVEEM